MSSEPIGDWASGVQESLYKDVPTYGEADLDYGVELRYHNEEPLEHSHSEEVYYEVVDTSTTVGLGKELFGKQRKQVSEDRAKELLEEHSDNEWAYME